MKISGEEIIFRSIKAVLPTFGCSYIAPHRNDILASIYQDKSTKGDSQIQGLSRISKIITCEHILTGKEKVDNNKQGNEYFRSYYF